VVLPMNYLVTVLTLSTLGTASAQQPVNLIAILARTAADTLPMCEQLIAKAMNDQSTGSAPHFTFACSRTWMDLNPATLTVMPSAANPSPFRPPEKPTVAIAHTTDPSDTRHAVAVFELFRLADLMSDGFVLKLCTQLITGITEVHYTCEPDDDPTLR
jgi:hypothetical protein